MGWFTPFEDYMIRARLWLATTKVKGRFRGPLVLKSLTGTPFETFKHYIKELMWLNGNGNAETLLSAMDQPEHYGEDQQEHMLRALSRVTYHTKRSRSETWRDFFARWDVAMRKVHHHKIALPAEYEGFLLINGLQLHEGETRALLNFTRGCIKPVSIKDWLRKNEPKLAASELGADKKKTSSVLHTEMDYDVEIENDQDEELDQEIAALETFLTDLQPDQEADETETLEEDEAAEILATMIRQKKTFRESMKEKKDRELSRGYGFAGKNSKGKGEGAGFVKPGQYRVSIEEVKRRTRCNNCGVVGHWKKECTALYGTSQKFQQGERCFQKRVFQIFV